MKRLLAVLMICSTAVPLAECAPFYISFRWQGGPAPTRAYRADGTTSLPAGSTMLVYVSTTDSTAEWTDQWADGNDAGNYGARDDDEYLGSISCGPAGAYNTGNIIENPTTHNGDYVYFVIVDTPYTTFDDTFTLPTGSDYALMNTTFQVNQYDEATQPGQFQSFSPGITLTTNNDITIVPEPTTLALFATGVGVLMMRRRKNRAGETEQSA